MKLNQATGSQGQVHWTSHGSQDTEDPSCLGTRQDIPGGIPVASCSASFPSFTLSVGFFLLLLRPRPMLLFVYLVRNIISINISIDFYWRNVADWARMSLSQIQTNHWGKNSLAQLGEESLLTVSMCQEPLGDGDTADYRTDTILLSWNLHFLTLYLLYVYY